MVVSAHRPRCPRCYTALLRFSEELGIGKERPEHAPQEVGCVQNPGTGAGFGRQCLPGVCCNPKRPRVVPGHRCFASVGRKLSLLPRRETSSGSGQTHRKALSSASTQRERGNPYGERSGTGYCQKLNARLRRHERRLYVFYRLPPLFFSASGITLNAKSPKSIGARNRFINFFFLSPRVLNLPFVCLNYSLPSPG